MGIIKLQNAGESLTATVTKAERVQGQYGEQVKFTLPDGDLYVPLDSALRQLERIPLAVEECAGETLVFARDPNNSRPGAKPYWAIRLAGAADRAAPSKRLSYAEANTPQAAAPRATPQVNPPITGAALAQEKARVARAYLDLFGYVKAQPEMQGVSDVAVQAASATIWIAWNQQGLMRAEPPKAEPPKAEPPKPQPSKPPHDFSNFPPEPEGDDSLPFS